MKNFMLIIKVSIYAVITKMMQKSLNQLKIVLLSEFISFYASGATPVDNVGHG